MSWSASFGVACALLLTLAPSLAYAVPTVEDKESARNLFKMADEKFQAGDYEGALVSFKAADAIMRLPTTGLEVGRTLAKLDKLIEAREKFRRVATLEPEEDEVQVQTDARGEARALFEKLEDQIPSLQVRLKTPDGSKVDGPSVLVDGEELLKEAALLPRRVNPGTHIVVVEASGFRREERKITLKVGQSFVLEVDLVSDTPGSAPQPAPPTPKQEVAGDDTLVVVSVVLLAVGGASLVVGGATGVFTLMEADDLEASCPDKRCTPGDEEQLDKTVTLSHVSTGTLVAGGLIAGAGLLTLLLAGGDGEAADADDAATLRLRPLIGPAYVGVGGVF